MVWCGAKDTQSEIDTHTLDTHLIKSSTDTTPLIPYLTPVISPCVGVLTTAVSGLVCVLASQQMDSNGDWIISASTAGIALAFALTLPGELNWMLRNIRLVSRLGNQLD